MVGLGIELRCKALDLFARDPLIGTLEAHAENKIIEPLDHVALTPNGPRWSFGTVRQLREIICDREPRRFTCDVNMKLRSNARVIIQSTERQAIVPPSAGRP
jgi:hypothetical protein